MKKVSILLADDHVIVRQGLKALLEAEPDMTVVGETGEGVETLRMVEVLNPDILVLDLAMPGLGGLEVARELCRRSSKTRVIILTVEENESFVVEALKRGVSAFVLKQSGFADVIRAIREAMAGRRFLSSPFSDMAIRDYVDHIKSSPFDILNTLTPRERQVIQLAAEGYTNSGIAKRLSISQRTVETHRANAMHKLGLHNHVELVMYAVNKGIIHRQVGTDASRSSPTSGPRTPKSK